jgi:hypothetical protein
MMKKKKLLFCHLKGKYNPQLEKKKKKKKNYGGVHCFIVGF